MAGRPPELITEGILTKAADVYAFGVITWEIYVGRYSAPAPRPARSVPRHLASASAQRWGVLPNFSRSRGSRDCVFMRHAWILSMLLRLRLVPAPAFMRCLGCVQACLGWAEAHRGAEEGGIQHQAAVPTADTTPPQGKWQLLSPDQMQPWPMLCGDGSPEGLALLC